MAKSNFTSHDQALESSNEAFLLSEGRPQEHEPKPIVVRPKATLYSKWIQDWWLAEIASLVLGIVAVISICVVLLDYQDKPAPALNAVLGVGITLNTIIAILSTVGRASLLYPVVQCMSQQKWAWFSSRPRPLTDLETFDQGAQGALGSLLLLWSINVRNFVSIGAVLVILGLAIDPLSQQLLRYDLQPVAQLSSPAYVSTALQWATDRQQGQMLHWEKPTTDVLSLVADPPLYTKAAVQAGLLSAFSIINDTEPFCSTGNCTWPTYLSLAVCMRSQDVSEHVQKIQLESKLKQKYFRYFLNEDFYIDENMNGVRLNVSSVATNTPIIDDNTYPDNALNFSQTIAFSDNLYPIADIFVMYNNGSAPEDTRFSAFEILLEWCVQEFSTTVINGIATTTRGKSTNKFTGDRGSFIIGPRFNTTDDFASQSVMSDALADAEYMIANVTHFRLSNYIRKTIKGSVSNVANSNPSWLTTSDAAEAIYRQIDRARDDQLQGDVGQKEDVEKDLRKFFQNIATSLTNDVRTAENHTFATENIWALRSTFMRANGTAWREQAFVRVQWGWIAGPMTLAILSLLFVAITVVQSSRHRQEVWKSSSLATLLALSDEIHSHIGGVRSASENESLLKPTKASMVQVSEGAWRLRSAQDI
ncbi:hypothetical protein BU24DRAFT_427444 [Aaosphaeria arxii CBS 175.79]|uniref:Uncharacterized protein n=1 Tax=Aaosphaeria arxii CBS 175.79 TaxID=1450172 RepID=A0A6A5XBI6_9PLEO|nr:uncharacterized protein BU24DRAFT_427444 [Aaosphaeria arxii CBS 175.79]KAF2010318.1 hypothetical protein BU24DRAFT_427444 [Aaosphaeria arxii CBS 175.79]